MSYIPALKTPIGQPRRSFRTDSQGIASSENGTRADRFAEISKSRPAPSQVRFKSVLPSSKNSISLNQNERERRKHEALEFLRKETRASHSTNHSIPRKYTSRQNNPDSLKTYQLLGERPIDRIPGSSSRSAIYDDQTVKNITRESLRRNPLGYTSQISDRRSRVSKPNNSFASKNNGLLSSLSNFGSKVFRSILYSEQDTNPNEPSSQPSFSSLGSFRSDLHKEQDDILRSEIKQKELDLQLEERRRYLDELNRQIVRTEKTLASDSPKTIMDQSKSIDQQIGKLDERLQNILEEVNSTSNGKLLKELESIKGELTTLRRKQESNNMKFESRFEDMKLENQLNRQKFDQLFEELEEKRKELDLEKDTLIKILQRNGTEHTNTKFDKRKNYTSEANIDTTARKRVNSYTKGIFSDNENGENDDDDDDDDDDNDDEAGSSDIMKYIKENRRRNTDYTPVRVRNRIRQITNSLKKIEKAAKKT
ncbi:hypothetical protein PICMEDRAFT_73083 [Pichia membranifaciens NRRL Y-2026]|uniref:Uncharacterized protein n=1 Tax=Pichia membranifaciens NRRL Y-2026 TaxID=763406 RepID=A0A1E3NHE1_9ASCO|nr:hypothetical protein PICMEDRAFT_73083 [Pichia membranifaciens NRRL Y-2026]ODQ45565.1 hypothetical protein PICMEDRAFT_73083 [Pichia membranifaciens NRRL Y-2026]